MPLVAGTRLGPYEILAPLGAGGMGEVYRALDTRLDRDVAVKVLPSGLANDPAALARFEREAKAVAALSHPNILAVHDFGTAGGTSYAVMELLDGESLRQRISENDGALPLRKATEIAREIALGLAAAHEKGIVHRDLKPENLFLTKDGRVKILDFGLARQVSLPAPGDTHSPTQTPDTEPGTVLGTVGYMAPEQLRGQPADHRSDIFSFGAVLYEMLTGRRAFLGDSAIETMNAILKEDPPEISGTGRAIPPGLERLVAHCLEKRPEERFQSARDLAFDLGSHSTATPASSPGVVARSRSGGRRRAVFAAAGTLGLIAAFWVGSRVAAPAAGGEVSFRRLTFRRGNILSARFAPDGQTVVYGAAWEGRPSELFSVRTDSVESRPLGLDHANIVSISPKGDLALKLRRGSFQLPEPPGTLARLPLGGGAPRELVEDVVAATWTNGNEELAVLRRAPEGKDRIEWPIGRVLYESYFLKPRLAASADGSQVLFVESDNAGRSTIGAIDRSGKRRVLTQGWRWKNSGIACSRRTGEVLFIGSKSQADEALWAVSPSGRERMVWRAPPGFLVHDIAPDGRLLVERFVGRQSVLFTGPGVPERDLGWLDATQLQQISPDGKSILFDEIGEGEGLRRSVYLRPTDGGPAIRLGDGTPQAFSRDGKWILTITSDTPPELVLLPVGPGAPRKIPSPGLNPIMAFFMAGESVTVLSSAPGQPTQAYELDPNGASKPKPVDLPGINWDAHGEVTPDRRLVAYSTTDRKILLAVEGRKPAPIPNTVLSPGEYITIFSPDQRFLQTQTQSEIPAKIFRTDIKTGEKTLWKEVEPADRSGVIAIDEVHFTPDQSAYAYTYNRLEDSDLYVVEGLR